jgi:hypothetical protein
MEQAMQYKQWWRASLCALVGLAGRPAAAAQACHRDEIVFFACHLHGHVVALCGSADLDRAHGTLAYRYGKPGRAPELEYPRDGTPARRAFRAYQDGGTKARKQAVGFTLGHHAYSVYSTRSSFGYNGAGVIVSKDGKTVADLPCDPGTVDDGRLLRQAGALGLPEGELAVRGAEFTGQP